MGRGEFRAGEGSCTGENSCQSWDVGTNPDETTSFFVGIGACRGDNSCQGLVSADLNGYIFVGDGACTGANSCQNIVLNDGLVELNIGEGACTEDNSCQECPNFIIPAGCQACDGTECGSDTSGEAYLQRIFLVRIFFVVLTHNSVLKPCSW